MNTEIQEVANTVVENLEKDLPISKYVEIYNRLAEAVDGDHEPVTRFTSKQDGYKKTVHLAREIAVEEAVAGLKAVSKKSNGVKKETSPGKRYPTVVADTGDKKLKLVNTLSVKEFNGVKKITVDRELNPKSYFNADWFEKRNIEVEVKS